MTRNRFVLQQDNSQPGWWVCSDRVHNIACRFEEHKFNDRFELILLAGQFKTKATTMAIARYHREMVDWLFVNHCDKIF